MISHFNVARIYSSVYQVWVLVHLHQEGRPKHSDSGPISDTLTTSECGAGGEAGSLHL